MIVESANEFTSINKFKALYLKHEPRYNALEKFGEENSL